MEILSSRSPQATANKVYVPTFFRLTQIEEAKALEELLVADATIVVHDEIYGQLRELIKSLHPTQKFDDKSYAEKISEHLKGVSLEQYGVWVYYPWSKRVVHLLDEEEFVYLRTAANRDKITKEELQILSTKKVGIIGLSVGQSVAVTLSMERSVGELRIADFDTLELNNLNRLRTGVHNLGLLKVVTVAREIAEIDPFLKVVLYPDGISENNIIAFYTDGGKLDAVIDECDGVDVKILCRIKAKELGIPVIMEASDRGTVDVERFDLKPDRPIVHGWLEHLQVDMNVLKALKTSEQKLPYMLPISGLETISPRMKASMMEIEQTLTTWPQLASAVSLGGAITTDVCRRIFLDQFHDSGRYFVDIEQIIGDKDKEIIETEQPVFFPGIQDADMYALIERYGTQMESTTLLSNETITSLVEAAILAPTGGNSQPWKWKYANNLLYLFQTSEYTTRLVDFKHSASAIGFGAATENLIIKAQSLNLSVGIEKYPLGEQESLIAVYKFDKLDDEKEKLYTHLVNNIPHRRTNRRIKDRQKIDNAALDKIANVVTIEPNQQLSITTNMDTIIGVADIMGKADKLRILHKGGHVDFLAEIIWPEETTLPIKRGLDINTLHLTGSERIGFKIAKDWNVINYLNQWKKGSGLERVTRKTAEAASAIGLITIAEFNKSAFFDAGRYLERIWLTATAQNISFQPISISTFLINRKIQEGDEILGNNIGEEVENLHNKLLSLFNCEKGRVPAFLFRLFIDEEPWPRSQHMDVQDVLFI